MILAEKTDRSITPYGTPGEALDDQVRQRPDAIALSFPESGGRLTFGQWRDAAECVARGLLDLGVKPGDRVAILAENRLEWPVVQIAAALGGFILVPLNSHYRRDDLSYALELSGGIAIFLSRAFRSNTYLENLTAAQRDGARH